MPWREGTLLGGIHVEERADAIGGGAARGDVPQKREGTPMGSPVVEEINIGEGRAAAFKGVAAVGDPTSRGRGHHQGSTIGGI